MRTTIFVALLLAALGSLAAGEPPAPAAPDQVVLLDIQGLWGGVDLWIANDGKAVCRHVGPPRAGGRGLQESRHAFSLSSEQQAELAALVERHGFFTLEIADRPGVPDESRPILFIQSGARRRAVAKWGNDAHPDFDPLYRFLLAVARAGRAGSLLAEGAYDPEWQPEGFEPGRAIRDMAQPAPAAASEAPAAGGLPLK